MAKIELERGNVQRLETGNVVQYPQGGGPIGAAVEGFGNMGSAVAERWQQKQEQQDRFDAAIIEQEFQEQVLTHEDEAIRDAPIDGKGLTESVYGQMDFGTETTKKPGSFQEIWDAAKARVPKTKTADFEAKKRFYELQGSRRLAAAEYTGRQAYETVQIQKNQDRLVEAISGIDPNDVESKDAYKRQGLDLIAKSGLKDKETASQNWSANADKAFALVYAEKDPARLRSLLGLGAPAPPPGQGRSLGTASGSRGLRNNNPGNIEYGDFAKGKGATGTDGRFAKFDTPEQGVQAMAALLRSYQGRGLNTVRKMIDRWNPKSDGQPGNYIPDVARAMGISPDTPFDFSQNPDLAGKMLAAMIGQENGKNPYSITDLKGAIGGERMSAGAGVTVDPMFADISFEDRIKLANTADANFNQMQTQAKTDATAAYDQYKDSVDVGIERGEKTLDQVNADPQLNDGDKAIFLRRMEAKGKNDAIDAAMLERLGGDDSVLAGTPTEGGVSLPSVFDPSKGGEDEKSINRIYDKVVNPGAVASGDTKAVNTMFGLWSKTGILPKQAKGEIEGMLRSRDTATIGTGLSYLDALNAKRPEAFNMDAGDDLKKMLAKYHAMQDGYSPQEIAESIRKFTDPAERKAREDLLKLAQPEIDKIGIDEVRNVFDPGVMPWQSDPSAPEDAVMAQQMLNEYKGFVAEQYTGDMGLAKKEAAQRLSKTWAPSAGNDGRLMKFAPELYYAPVNGSYDYLTADVENAVRSDALVPDTVLGLPGTLPPYRIMATPDARGEIAAGRPPSYFVAYEDEDGGVNMLMGRDGAPLPLRFDRAKYAGEAVTEAQQARTQGIEAIRQRDEGLADLGKILEGLPVDQVITGQEVAPPYSSGGSR